MADINENIEEIVNRLSESRDIVQFFNEIRRLTSLSAEDAKALAAALKGISKSTRDLIGNFEDVSNGLRKTKDIQKDLTKSIKDQRNLEIEINKQLRAQGFTQSEIKTILNGTADDREYLLRLAESALDVDIGIIDAAVEANRLQAENIAQARENLKIAKNYNKALGLAGGLVNGISDAAKKLGVDYNVVYDAIEDSKKAMREMAQEVTENGQKAVGFGGKLKVMGAGISGLFKGIVAGLSDPLFIFEQIFKVILDLDEQIGKVAKNFGIAYEEAAELSSKLNDTANKSNELFITTENLTETFLTLNNRYSTFANLSDENLKTFTRLTEQAGYTAEEIGSLFDTTLLTGKELEDTTKEYLGQVKLLKAQTGLALNEKELLKDILTVSSATKIQLGGSAEAIATAVFKAKALGMELKDLESVSNSLLNFQSSIENELAAELLTGKQLNLEGARYASLIGDQAMLADELAKNIGTAADFNKMNVLQQEALAESVGLTRDTLADSLLQREALSRLEQFDGKTAKEKYDNAVRELGVEGARKKLGNDALADQMRSASVQERFLAAVEKIKEVFVSLAEPLMPVLDVLASMLKIIGPIVGGVARFVKFLIDGIVPLKQIVGLFTIYKGIQLGINIAKQTQLAYGILQYSIDTKQISLAATKEALEGKSLALKIATYSLALKDLVVSRVKLGVEKVLGIFQKKNLFTSIGEAAMTAIKGLAGIPIVGWGLGLAAAGAVTALGYQFLKDGMIGPDGGLIVSGEKGTYKLDKNDTVIAGTDINKPTRPSNNTPTTNTKPAALPPQNLNNNINLSVNLDGRKMNNINVRQSNKIGMNSKVLGKGIDVSS